MWHSHHLLGLPTLLPPILVESTTFSLLSLAPKHGKTCVGFRSVSPAAPKAFKVQVVKPIRMTFKHPPRGWMTLGTRRTSLNPGFLVCKTRALTVPASQACRKEQRRLWEGRFSGYLDSPGRVNKELFCLLKTWRLACAIKPCSPVGPQRMSFRFSNFSAISLVRPLCCCCCGFKQSYFSFLRLHFVP